MIEEAAHGTHFGNTIQPFKRGKYGRGASLALLLSHVGGDKWEIITKINIAWLMTTIRYGKNTSLSSSVPIIDQNTPNMWKPYKHILRLQYLR